MKKNRWWLLLIPAALVLGPCGYWVFAVNATELQARTTIHEFRVPAGFEGWAVVKHGVPGAPALPVTRDGIVETTVFAIPSSGLLETSTPLVRGHFTPRYFRSERGGAVLVKWDPEPFSLRDGTAGRCLVFYVSTGALRADQDAPPLPDHGCDG